MRVIQIMQVWIWHKQMLRQTSTTSRIHDFVGTKFNRACLLQHRDMGLSEFTKTEFFPYVTQCWLVSCYGRLKQACWLHRHSIYRANRVFCRQTDPQEVCDYVPTDKARYPRTTHSDRLLINRIHNILHWLQKARESTTHTRTNTHTSFPSHLQNYTAVHSSLLQNNLTRPISVLSNRD